MKTLISTLKSNIEIIEEHNSTLILSNEELEINQNKIAYLSNLISEIKEGLIEYEMRMHSNSDANSEKMIESYLSI